jgi:hypothetical protein
MIFSSLEFCHCSMAASHIRACSLVSCHFSRAHSCMQFDSLPLHYSDCKTALSKQQDYWPMAATWELPGSAAVTG